MTLNTRKKRVKDALNREIPLVLTTSNFLRNIEDQLFLFLKIFLNELELNECEQMIVYALRELAANANKANMKRLYFLEKNLDIENSDHYRIGMETFKDEAFVDIDSYTSRLLEQGLYVKFHFHVKDDIFSITIINNSSLSVEEEMRINDKIQKAWTFESMAEATSHILDETEGAGLGIVSIIMMLRNMGVSDRDALRIIRRASETHSVMRLPYRDPSFGIPTPSLITEL